MISNSFLTIAKENKRISFVTYKPTTTASQTVFLCIPSLGDVKEEYRLLAPKLCENGHYVHALDHRGLGKSDVNFSSYDPQECGKDIVEFVDTQITANQKVVIVGNSMGGAAAIWAASERPKKVAGVILLNPFVRDHPFPFGMATLLNLLMNRLIGPSFWTSYYSSLYKIHPSPVSDLNDYCSKLQHNLKEPGRLEATRQQLFASKKYCTERIASVANQGIPVLALFGDKDPDFKNPEDEAKWIVNSLKSFSPSHPSSYEMIVGAGHYPQVEAAERVHRSISSFLNTLPQ